MIITGNRTDKIKNNPLKELLKTSVIFLNTPTEPLWSFKTQLFLTANLMGRFFVLPPNFFLNVLFYGRSLWEPLLSADPHELILTHSKLINNYGNVNERQIFYQGDTENLISVGASPQHSKLPF